MKTLATSSFMTAAMSILLLGQSALAQSTTLIVDAQGSGYTKIQDAIDAAQPGDLVLVMPGIYQGPGNRDMDFQGKAITVQSTGGPAATVIDCQASMTDNHRAFTFRNGEESDSRVEGFTIRNGLMWFPETDAGAIYCLNSSPTIKNNHFENCRSQGDGGAIYCQNSSAVILRNRFQFNQAGFHGGAISAWASQLRVERNFLIENSSSRGGAVYQAGLGTLHLSRNLIRKNYASSFGAGVYTDPGTSLICSENDFVENFSNDRGGGLYAGDSATVVGNRFLKNHADTYGGGLLLGFVPTGSVEDNLIEENDAVNGAGIMMEATEISLRRNRILQNVATGNGGGLLVGLYGNHLFTMESNALVGNQATNGAGIYARDYHSYAPSVHFFLDNNTLSGNQASAKGGALYLESSKPFAQIRNSILWGNTAASGAQVFHTTAGMLPVVSQSDVQGGIAGVNNLDIDPLFATDEFHLMPGSPCVDSGDSSIVAPGALDVDGQARIQGAQVDLGADEI